MKIRCKRISCTSSISTRALGANQVNGSFCYTIFLSCPLQVLTRVKYTSPNEDICHEMTGGRFSCTIPIIRKTLVHINRTHYTIGYIIERIGVFDSFFIHNGEAGSEIILVPESGGSLICTLRCGENLVNIMYLQYRPRLSLHWNDVDNCRQFGRERFIRRNNHGNETTPTLHVMLRLACVFAIRFVDPLICSRLQHFTHDMPFMFDFFMSCGKTIHIAHNSSEQQFWTVVI